MTYAQCLISVNMLNGQMNSGKNQRSLEGSTQTLNQYGIDKTMSDSYALLLI